MGEEKAFSASFGKECLDPPNLPPDITITNLILGTLVRTTPCKTIYPSSLLLEAKQIKTLIGLLLLVQFGPDQTRNSSLAYKVLEFEQYN